MTTSAMSLKSVICLDDAPLKPVQLGYLTSRAQSDAHEMVLQLFLKLSAREGLTKAFVARRLGKKPEQITRWLGSPGNITVATVAQLLAAMGHAPTFGATELNVDPVSNQHHAMSRLQYMLPPKQKVESQIAQKEDVANFTPGIIQRDWSKRQEEFLRDYASAIQNHPSYRQFLGALM